MNANDQLIKDRCMAFCNLLAEQALAHPTPEAVMDSVMNLMLAKMEGGIPNEDDLANLHSALVGFCLANDFLAHYDEYQIEYMDNVMVIFEITAIEIAMEEMEGDNGESSYLQ